MRFKEDWKCLGYNNPEIKDLDKIMSDEEALEFFNKLMYKYLTLKKLKLTEESDKFVLGFKNAIEFLEKGWDTWIYRSLPSICQKDNLSYCEAMKYDNVRKIETKNLTGFLYLTRYVG